METKAQIRKKHLEIRNAMKPEEVKDESKRIVERLLKSDLYQNAQQICVYYPLGNEVSLIQLIEQSWKDGKKTLFPKIVNEDMIFCEIDAFSQLEEGYFHVMEPIISEKTSVARALILVPGVCFDRNMGRCGFGKGFYDRFLASHADCISVGVAYENQLEYEIPMDEQDIRMQYIYTQEGEICS